METPEPQNLEKKRRVLVLNDSAPTLSTIGKWCEIHGYGVVTAQLSQMRLAHLNVQRIFADNRPDVIVFDLAMPTRRTGTFWK